MSMNNKALSFILILVGVAMGSSLSIVLSYRAQVAAAPATTSPITTARTNIDVKVQVGGGNWTNPLMGYKPQKVEIKVGDS